MPVIIYFYPISKGTLVIAIFWALLSIVINFATPEVYSCTIAVLLFSDCQKWITKNIEASVCKLESIAIISKQNV